MKSKTKYRLVNGVLPLVLVLVSVWLALYTLNSAWLVLAILSGTWLIISGVAWQVDRILRGEPLLTKKVSDWMNKDD